MTSIDSADTAAHGLPTPLGYRPGLDGLRAVAVIMVLLHHLTYPGMQPRWASSGLLFIGVDIFFVVSGFLITRLLLDEVLVNGTVALGNFWARRVLRLLPLLTVVVAAVAVANALDPHLFVREGQTIAPWRSMVGALGYHMNVLQMFPGTHHTWALTHTWSLSIEEQFYVVWPLAVLAAARSGRDRACIIVFTMSAAVVVISSLERFILQEGGHLDYVYNSLDSRAGQLGMGTALGAASLLWPRLVARIAPLGWLGLLALVALAARDYLRFFPGSLTYDFVGLASVPVIVAACALGPDLGLARVLRGATLRWIGVRSYALYLVHYPVFLALTREHTALGRLPLMGLRVVSAFVLADLAHRLVERPANGLRKRFINRQRHVRPVPLDRGVQPATT